MSFRHAHRRDTVNILTGSQCSKLLADTSVIKFYPSKFVLITDVLDKFGALKMTGKCALLTITGSLVFSRLLSKAAPTMPGSNVAPRPLDENFTSDQVRAARAPSCHGPIPPAGV